MIWTNAVPDMHGTSDPAQGLAEARFRGGMRRSRMKFGQFASEPLRIACSRCSLSGRSPVVDAFKQASNSDGVPPGRSAPFLEIVRKALPARSHRRLPVWRRGPCPIRHFDNATTCQGPALPERERYLNAYRTGTDRTKPINGDILKETQVPVGINHSLRESAQGAKPITLDGVQCVF
jgi:hypothetical protein